MSRVVAAVLVVTVLATAVSMARSGPPPPEPVLFVVRVNDPTGRAVHTAFVSLMTRAGSESTWARDGIAEFRRLPGGADAGWEMTLEVMSPMDSESRGLPLAPVSTHVAPASHEVALVLPVELRISGRVVGPTGGGVRDVLMRASRASHYLRGSKDYADDFRTDAEGRFDVGGLSDEEHVLEVHPPPAFTDLAPARVRAGTRDVVLELRDAVAASVVVRDTKGAPISGAFVVASGSSQATGRTRSAGSTDASGVAQVGGLAPDIDYTLEISFPADDKVHEDARIEHWRPRDDTIHIAEARRLAGTVRDPASRPLGGIYVSIDEGRSYGGPPTWHAYTNADGTFVFDKVPRGELTIVSRLAGDRRPLSSMTRVPAEAASVDVVLDPGRTLQVHLENLQTPNRERRHTAVLRCDDASDPDFHHEHEVPPDGRVVFRGLRDGATYRLVVTGVAGYSAVRGGLHPGDDVTVAIVQGGTVRGRVIAPKGFHRISVWVGGDPPIAETETGLDGTFVLMGIPKGRWRIHAATSLGGQGLAADGDVAAGDEIDLTLTPR